MTSAFLLTGFSPDKTFADPSLDVLKDEMSTHDVLLEGVTEGWKEYGVRGFGQRAFEHSRTGNYDGILIGHSLGALAALSVIDVMPVQHLVLCSPSALFSEDLATNVSPAIRQRIGEARVRELADISATQAAASVGRLAIPTTILFGQREHKLYPHLVARSKQLAAAIAGAELREIAGAAHSISENPYAHEVAQIVSDIATELVSS